MLFDLISLDGISDDFLREVQDFIDEWNNDADVIQVRTSGSTGASKTISLEKNRVRASAIATGKYFDFEAEQVALLNLSPSYIAGKLMIVRAIEHNMKLILAPVSSNPLLNLKDIKVDFAAFVPSQIKSILENELSKNALYAIRNVIIGGAPLLPRTESELTLADTNIYASFGMTETITHFALRKLGTPIYKCLEGFEISIDENSCLIIQPNEVIPEILATNDVIIPINKSTFKWSGRFDNVINSSGIKIHPEKVEKMISHLIPSNRFYVSSKKDDTYGEVAVLIVEGEFDETEILLDAKMSLPKHHAPKELIQVKSFKETKTHKIIREKF
jgi:o-succinylbenzoate---CoA ligase